MLHFYCSSNNSLDMLSMIHTVIICGYMLSWQKKGTYTYLMLKNTVISYRLKILFSNGFNSISYRKSEYNPQRFVVYISGSWNVYDFVMLKISVFRYLSDEYVVIRFIFTSYRIKYLYPIIWKHNTACKPIPSIAAAVDDIHRIIA